MRQSTRGLVLSIVDSLAAADNELLSNAVCPVAIDRVKRAGVNTIKQPKKMQDLKQQFDIGDVGDTFPTSLLRMQR